MVPEIPELNFNCKSRSFIILLILIINTNTYSQNARIDFCNINYDILDFQEVLNMILENEISLAKYDTIYFKDPIPKL